jgi:hypothetical protein
MFIHERLAIFVDDGGRSFCLSFIGLGRRFGLRLACSIVWFVCHLKTNVSEPGAVATGSSIPK